MAQQGLGSWGRLATGLASGEDSSHGKADTNASVDESSRGSAPGECSSQPANSNANGATHVKIMSISGETVLEEALPKPLTVRKLKVKLAENGRFNPLKIKLVLNDEELKTQQVVPPGSEDQPTVLNLVLSDDATSKWAGLALTLDGRLAPMLRGDYDRDCDE
mmetsp:Transcript_11266/g.21289  ORF Transcript_11266/g.21289 Transcript_11266/m.21289 type:complete len:163 (+) Transcript_11266:72-560(+)